VNIKKQLNEQNISYEQNGFKHFLPETVFLARGAKRCGPQVSSAISQLKNTMRCSIFFCHSIGAFNGRLND
jgi:hypothetical protein